MHYCVVFCTCKCEMGGIFKIFSNKDFCDLCCVSIGCKLEYFNNGLDLLALTRVCYLTGSISNLDEYLRRWTGCKQYEEYCPHCVSGPFFLKTGRCGSSSKVFTAKQQHSFPFFFVCFYFRLLSCEVGVFDSTTASLSSKIIAAATAILLFFITTTTIYITINSSISVIVGSSTNISSSSWSTSSPICEKTSCRSKCSNLYSIWNSCISTSSDSSRSCILLSSSNSISCSSSSSR